MTKTQIFISPNILIFLLDEKNIKEEDKIKFILEQKINLDKYIEQKESPRNYELNGFVFYDNKKNKYNALCVSPVDKQWYLYDDEKVTLSKFETFIQMYSKSMDYKPCILVYKGFK